MAQQALFAESSDQQDIPSGFVESSDVIPPSIQSYQRWPTAVPRSLSQGRRPGSKLLVKTPTECRTESMANRTLRPNSIDHGPPLLDKNGLTGDFQKHPIKRRLRYKVIKRPGNRVGGVAPPISAQNSWRKKRRASINELPLTTIQLTSNSISNVRV